MARLERHYELVKAAASDPANPAHEQLASLGVLGLPGWPTPTFVRAAAKVGRNDPCPCGSGKKFKRCCAKVPSPAGSDRGA